MNGVFSLARWWAVAAKEFIQLRRDRVTFAVIIGIPVMQLALFGYAINTDPKRMPTAVLDADRGEFARTVVSVLRWSDYFAVVDGIDTEAAAEEALARGDVQFVVTIPPDFTARVARGEYPAMLIEADATDSSAVGAAMGMLGQLPALVSARDFRAPLAGKAGAPGAFEVRTHRRYNPEGLTRYNIVPGLMGVILVLTMSMMTGLALIREHERGTMENLLSMPVRPLEVMAGKIVPYVAIGMVQSTIILAAAHYVFGVPVFGSLWLVYAAAMLFVIANLTVGIAISSLATNQLQAMQMTMFYFLPNILLSGFMFPFRGMPVWAQAIGNILPLTYFNRLIRGLLLKGNGLRELWPDLWPLGVFTLIAMGVAVLFYRRTMD